MEYEDAQRAAVDFDPDDPELQRKMIAQMKQVIERLNEHAERLRTMETIVLN